MKKIFFILFLISISVISFSQTIQLRKPTSADSWPAFSKQRIEWTSTNIDNIKIESSLDSGKTWNIVELSYPAPAQFYEWEVINKTSDSCFIRISDVTDPTKSSSNYPSNPFKIPKPGITLDQPPALAIRGTILPITWISSGIRKVNIYASFNNKQSFRKIADTIIANNFYYNWLVPDSVSTQCFIAIQDASIGLYSDTSKVAFATSALASTSSNKFKGGQFDGHSSATNNSLRLTLLSLNNGDSLYGSSIKTITWSSQNIERINILYSPNNGVTWELVADQVPAYATKYDWKVSNTQTSLGKIKIINSLDTTILSSNIKPFVIRKKVLKFNQPDSTTIAFKSTVLPIGWESGGINNLKIKFLNSNKQIIIIDSIPAKNEMHNWIISQTNSDTIQLVLLDLSDSTLTDTTKKIILKQLEVVNNAKYKGGAFDGHATKTNSKSSLQLISPNGKEKLSVLNNFTISWRSNNIERLKLELSIDSGKNWSLITQTLPASSNNYTWRTPNSPSTNCLLRITDAQDNSLFDVSDSLFSLLPKKLIITSDSTNWIKKTAKLLEWSPLGVDSLRILYKNRVNEDWKKITDSLPAKYEAFNWVIPSSLTDSLWLRMEDITDTSVNDSKFYFKKVVELNEILSSTKYKGGKFDGHAQKSNINKIIINRPLANEVLVGGTKYNITWSTINIEDSVWIQYSIDSGKTWASVTRTIATNGTYAWTIPNNFETTSSYDIGFGVIKSNSVNNLMQGLVQTSELIQNLADNAIQQSSSVIGINSTNCLIRVLDILSENVIVGKGNNTFTIIGATSKIKDSISFSKPKDIFLDEKSTIVSATSTSKRPVSFFIPSGNSKATFSGSTLNVSKAGKITIGAFISKDSIFLQPDTVYQTICIYPLKPVINYAGKLNLCVYDTVNLNGPDSSSQYLWSNGSLSKNIQITGSNTISLKVGEDGCYSIESDTLKFVQNNIITASFSSNGPTVFCRGDSVIFNSSNNIGNQWYRDGKAIIGATNSRYKADSSGNYNLLISLNGCTSPISSTQSVTVNPLPPTPTITASGPSSFCVGNSVTLTSSASVNNQWFLNGNPITNASSPSYAATQSGSYSVANTNTAGCLSIQSAPSVVSVNALPTTPSITASGPLSFCVGNSVTLTSSASANNQWFLNGNPISNASSPSYAATQSGSYSVANTNTAGCLSIQSAPSVVSVNALPTTPSITASGPLSFCVGNSVTLTSSASANNQWFLNGNPISNASSPSYAATQSGSYSVANTNTAGCLSSQSTPSVVSVNALPPTPTITASGALSFCVGNSVTLTSSASANNQWFLNGNPITNATSPSFAATQSGSYSVANTNTAGCLSSQSTPSVVSVNALPAKPIVTKNVNNLVSSSAVGNQWYNNSTLIPGATSSNFTPNSNGYYKTQVSIAGCLSIFSDLFYFNNSSSDNYQIMPNPVRESLTIQAKSNTNQTTIKLINANGMMLLTRNFVRSTSIDLTSYSSGIYTIILIDNITKIEESKQIIKQ